METSTRLCACGCGKYTNKVQAGSYQGIKKGEGHEFINGHRRTLLSWMPVVEIGCWIWMGTPNSSGYGQHVKSYETHRGPVPTGLELDHLCRTPLCGNPWHLEPVTKSENLIRKGGPLLHGTRRMYERDCRCDACRGYHNARHRAARLKRKAKT